ncbi:hypothetical protein OIU91_28315 [Streptomyces sp. NBC_01456]|uniref:hypothetical protein n=1 Tax=unclassified Streptomyces TaxID=2593676 RepID=UPI002E31B88D|nr:MULTISPECIES: hypothetical protein [unclassified Streptomyces]
MGQEERPVEGRPDQEEQARLIRRTGNGPTVENEEALLRERFGPPDMAGVFHTSDADTDQDDEPAADEAPAAEPEGGDAA